MRDVKDKCTRENKLHNNTKLLKVGKQEMGLTVAFARDLPKHAPLDLD